METLELVKHGKWNTLWSLRNRKHLKQRGCCERGTADKLGSEAGSDDLKDGFTSISPQKSIDSWRGDNHHMVLPSVSWKICPKDRQVLRKSGFSHCHPASLCFYGSYADTHLHPLPSLMCTSWWCDTLHRGRGELHNWAAPLHPRAAAGWMRSGLRKHAQI